MNCPFEDRLLEHVDGTLGARERAELDEHVASCEACARRLERIRSQRALLERVKTPEAPADLWPRLRERLNVERGRLVMPWPLSTAWKPLVGLAAAAVVIVASFVFFQHGTGTAPTPEDRRVENVEASAPRAPRDLDEIVREHELVAGLRSAGDLMSPREAEYVLVSGETP